MLQQLQQMLKEQALRMKWLREELPLNVDPNGSLGQSLWEEYYHFNGHERWYLSEKGVYICDDCDRMDVAELDELAPMAQLEGGF